MGSEFGVKTPTVEHCSKRLGRVDFTRREGGEGVMIGERAAFCPALLPS